jgi:hypothetical protein
MRLNVIAGTLAFALLATACGSGATGSGPGPSVAAPSSEESAAPGSEAAVTTAPSAAASGAAPSEAPAAGGGQAGDVCGLVTEAELGAILGTAVKAAVLAGPPDTCDIQSADGAPLAATVLTDMQGVSADFVFNAFAGSPTAEDVAGIGEKASYDPAQGALLVLKNGAVLTVAVFNDGTQDEARVLDLMKQIGAAAAGRM